MRHHITILAICFASILLLTACTAVPQPTPSPESAANVVTVPPKRPSATPTHSYTATPTIPIATATPSIPIATATATLSPTATKFIIPFVPTRTETPIRPTATNTPTATPAIPIAIAWQSGISELMRTDNLVWSPTKNEFVSYSGCRGSKTAIYFTNMFNSERIDITPENLLCYVTFLWHPSGNYFLFSAESLEEESLGEIVGWQVDPSSLNLNELEEPDYFWGWLNNELRVSERRIGTGINSIGITNMITEEWVSGTAFEGNAQGVSQNYVLLNEEYATSYNTYIAVLDQKEISPELLHLGGKYIKFLGKSLGEDWEHSFYSRFMDVLPNSDQVLVLTWQELVFDPYEITDVLTGVVPTNLQIWDINTDELVLIKEGGIYGRFSPNGNELVTLTATSDFPQLELLNRITNETIITQPAYAETAEYTVDVFAFTSFSPNGRFLTYYSPEQDLIIYDIVLGTFLPSVTAVPITPVWSPDNGRFVYQDPDLGLSIYEIEPNTTYSLTQAGCDELRNPQWSFDGSYLSVDIPCAGTAVLQLP